MPVLPVSATVSPFAQRFDGIGLYAARTNDSLAYSSVPGSGLTDPILAARFSLVET